MKIKDFAELDNKTQLAMMIAMKVRNAMEQFHAGKEGFITDAQMKEINKAVRQAIYDTLAISSYATTGSKDAQEQALIIIEMIPDYWEIPNESK